MASMAPIDVFGDERDVAGILWIQSEEQPWVQDVLVGEATLGFRTSRAKRKFIEVLESHEDEWLKILADSLPLARQRAEARAGLNLLRRLRG